MFVSWFWGALKRCKTLRDDPSKTPLARCLTIIDLTGLGIGSTLGLGVYVLAGSVAKTVAGPAVCLSFVVAAVASAFAGVCYAEFAARVPKAGSAYVYSYVSVGEFIAFTIGWNLILEYIIGTAGVAKGMSNYVDALSGYRLRDAFRSAMPMNLEHLADYPDFFAFLLVLVVTVLLAIGVKESTRANNFLTVLNLLTVITVIISGAFKADTHNWNISPDEIPEESKKDAGVGGFLPFGVAGVMAGAAKCFFGFVGFDCVATTGEEAINPQKNIPLSIAVSLIIIFASYFSIATILTMMVPYYSQDADAPFPYAFEEVGLPVIKWIVTVGAIFALCTSLLGALFPLPRVLYAMGNDGVLYRWMARVNKRTMTPLLATILSGIFSGFMAAIFNLTQLIDMMSIGTLMAYTIVAISVLVLRFEEDVKLKESLHNQEITYSASNVFRQLFNLDNVRYPTSLSYSIVKISIFLFSTLSLILSAVLNWNIDSSGIPLIVVLAILVILIWLVIQRQPQEDSGKLLFKVPLVPTVPCVSIFINLYLMVQLDAPTWIRFIIWLAVAIFGPLLEICLFELLRLSIHGSNEVVGYAIYFSYGIRNSTENTPVPTPLEENAHNSLDSVLQGVENNGYVPSHQKEITTF